jgi:uncharacterized protein
MIFEPPSLSSVVGAALAGVGAAYAIYGSLLFIRQSAIVFKPDRTLPTNPKSLGLEFHDVYVEAGRGARVHGWWIPGQSNSNLVLFFPGSIGNMSRELETFSFLLSLGASLMAIDYPGFGKSEGRPTESGCYRSAEAAWDFAVRVRGFPPQNIIIFGRSVGAAVAAWLAARHECAGLICHSGLTSVPEVAAQRYRFFPSRWFCYIRFNTLRYIAACCSPVLVMHSEQDRVIPVRHGRLIFEKAASPKRFLPIIGDHYSNDWQATPGLRAALKSIIESPSVHVSGD